jgi:glycosyltransferase involved in cell wall biosynthesis
MKKLLILGIPFNYQQGGAEYQYKILEEYFKEKFDVYYLFRHPKPLSGKKYLVYNYRFRQRYNPNVFTDAPVIYRLIKKISPDVIYKRSINYITAVGVLYAKLNNIKMVLHIAHQENVEKLKFQQKIKTIFLLINQIIKKYVIRNTSMIICQAEYQNTLLQKNFRRNCNLCLPNLHPIPDSKIVKRPPVKIVWIANFKQWKQPELFIELAEKFQDDQNIKFTMIGRPASGAWQRRLTKKINQLPNLEYRGELPIDEVNQILSESHIFVNTSINEGFPNTYIQAWMREVPVVALNCDPDNLIKTNKIGFHSKTFRQMIDDVKYLIKNKSVMEKMGKRANNYARETFSTSKAIKIVNLIEDTLN